MRNPQNKQQGSALFIMIMILVALSILTFMATNIGKTDARIGNAYTEQSRAFIKGEEMLSRLRYAIEQIPLPEGINRSDIDKERPVWETQKINALGTKGGEPDFVSPTFAANKNKYDGWNAQKTLTCKDIHDWVYVYADVLDCNAIDPTDNAEENNSKTRTIIELVSEKQSKGDIDETGNAYYYRITVYAKGDNNGSALVQGITGVRYY